jgi:ribosomal protein L37AE/L43A
VREVNKRIADLIKKQSSLLDDPSFDGEKSSLLENQKNKLRKLKKASICSCATCSDMKKDHVFVPKTREWYCEKCLERLEKGNYFQLLDENYFE